MNAFVDARTTFARDSSLSAALNIRHEDSIPFMLNEMWNVNGSDRNSALIFERILHSQFDNNGNRMLDALSSLSSRLYAAACLMGIMIVLLHFSSP